MGGIDSTQTLSVPIVPYFALFSLLHFPATLPAVTSFWPIEFEGAQRKSRACKVMPSSRILTELWRSVYCAHIIVEALAHFSNCILYRKATTSFKNIEQGTEDDGRLPNREGSLYWYQYLRSLIDSLIFWWTELREHQVRINK